MTVPLTDDPPATDVGEKVNAVSVIGVSVNDAVIVELPSVAVMVSASADATTLDVTLNVVVCDPAGITTVEG